VLESIAEDFDNVRFVYRHFPLMSIHDKAALATQASEAAGLQGMFWEMHDLLFENQAEWAVLNPDDFIAWVVDQATQLGMDADQFKKDMLSPEIAKIATDAWEGGQQLGLPGTPFLVLNDQIWPDNLPKSYDVVSTVVKLTLLEDKQYKQCPPMVIDPLKQYRATIKTTKGDLVLELFADQSPLAVNNFVFLARDGWYDNVPFNRVIPDFMAQSGDPSGTGYGGPGYAFINETSPDLNFSEAGVLAMANSGPDTNGSQFFITYAPTPDLDGNYTIFGQLVEGMDVLKEITPRNPQSSEPLPDPDLILTVIIEEN